MNPHLPSSKTVIYQTKAGSLELKTDVGVETIWLTQDQTATLFDVQKAAISKHMKNIFAIGELTPEATVSKMETVQKEGSRIIKRTMSYYNLDLVLSIGYRVNSKNATHFRQWATKILKEHIQEGYTINRNRIGKNYTEFLKAVDDVKSLLPTTGFIDHDSVIELIILFADTWLSLDAYDKDALVVQGITKKKVTLTAKKLNAALKSLKDELFTKGEASELFGLENKQGSIDGIIGNIMQSFAGKALYPSIEEKAAHLLYFIIKNHPFVDGNKRSGAYAFIWLLRQAKILDLTRITPQTLTALTILIAESNPQDKEKMIGLVCTLLARRKGVKSGQIDK